MSMGEKIKTMREKRGLAQSDLAVLTGISQPYISQFEKDKCKPTALVICSLARALECSADSLLDYRQMKRKRRSVKDSCTK